MTLTREELQVIRAELTREDLEALRAKVNDAARRKLAAPYDPIKHGTRTGSKKCKPRCHLCRAYDTKLRADHRAKHPPTVHGKYTSYKNGCRCKPCTDANTEWARDFRIRNRGKIRAYRRAYKARKQQQQEVAT